MMLKVMEDKAPTVKFLAIVKIPSEKTETIVDAIDKELNALVLNYENIIVFRFDGASTMTGNVGNVRKKFS